MPERRGEPAVSAKVIRLHTIRTLVIARDLAFRERAMTVLADLGVASFAIAAIDAHGRVLALIDHERPDVVVLDATGCAASIGNLVCELYEHAPRMGIVIVSSNDRDERLGLPSLPKWGWAADLARAVQEAYRQGNPLTEKTAIHAQ